MNKKLKKLCNILLTTVISLSTLTPLMVSADECTVKYHYLFNQTVASKTNGTHTHQDGVIGDSSTTFGTAARLPYSDRRVIFNTPSNMDSIVGGGTNNWKSISSSRYITVFSRILEKAAKSSNAVDISSITGNIEMNTSCVRYGSDYYCINDGAFDSTTGYSGLDELTKVLYQMYYYINKSNNSTCISNTKSAMNVLFGELENSIVNNEANFSISIVEDTTNPYYNSARNKIGFVVQKTYNSDNLFENYLTKTDVTDSSKQYVARKGINLFKYIYNMSKSCNNGNEVFGISADAIDEEGSFRVNNDVGTYQINGKTYSKYVGYMIADYTADFMLTECDEDIISTDYRVIYDANGGVGEPANQYVNSTSSSFTLSSTKPTRDGYTFLGWATSSSATTKKYDPSQTLQTSILSNTSDGDLTLYAVWQENSSDDEKPDDPGGGSVVDPGTGNPSDNDEPMNRYGAGVGLGIIALSLIGGTAGIVYVNKSGRFSKI